MCIFYCIYIQRLVLFDLETNTNFSGRYLHHFQPPKQLALKAMIATMRQKCKLSSSANVIAMNIIIIVQSDSLARSGLLLRVTFARPSFSVCAHKKGGSSSPDYIVGIQLLCTSIPDGVFGSPLLTKLPQYAETISASFRSSGP